MQEVRKKKFIYIISNYTISTAIHLEKYKTVATSSNIANAFNNYFSKVVVDIEFCIRSWKKK